MPHHQKNRGRPSSDQRSAAGRPLLPAVRSSLLLAKATPGGCGSSQRRSASLPAHPESDPLQSGVADLSLQSSISTVQQQSYGTS